MGPVHDILVENNWHNQTIAGGCAMKEHQATCPDNLTVQDNTLVSGSDWPAEAQAGEAAAGRQATAATILASCGAPVLPGWRACECVWPAGSLGMVCRERVRLLLLATLTNPCSECSTYCTVLK